jgi:hypothetical protein
MPQRLNRPLTILAEFSGPVRVGKFDDGTLLIGGPNDAPVLIREGCIMRLNSSATGEQEGDLVFAYEGVLRALAEAQK